MICINRPTVSSRDGWTRVAADIDVDGLKTSLWLEVEDRYGQYLLHERIDAFVLGLMHEAIRRGHDIVSEAPMTDRLYFQLTDQFLPAYFKLNGGGFKIVCPTAPEVEHPAGGAAIGTGASCGVDSLHVFAKHPEITHACVWNLHGVTFRETAEIRAAGWTNLVNGARRFAADIGCELVIGNTNFDRGCLPGVAHDGSTTYANLFCMMSLQKLWARYYVASGYDIGDFKISGVTDGTDPAHYEWALFPFCCLGRMAVYMDGVAQTRVEKVGDLVRYAPAKRHLNVCFGIHEGGRNCTSRCAKCMRTLLNLEVWDAVDEFSSVFDVGYFRSHYEEYIAELWRGYLQRNSFATEMRPYFLRRRIPPGIRLKAALIVLRKAVRKVLRGGRVSQGFTPR